MKKFTAILCALFVCTFTQAQESITFTTECIEVDDQPLSNGHPKSPVRPPVVFQEDNTLSFVSGHPEYELTIKDVAGTTAYSSIVSSAVIQVALPSVLSGGFVIELTMGNWKFLGWIEL